MIGPLDALVGEPSYDVVIVGAGAAGITLALELEGSGLTVALLEGGGVEPSAASQARYAGPLTLGEGLSYPPLDAWRLRYLGGTTGHWTGFCRPLEANVFGNRPGRVEMAWPFDAAALRPYYERAHPWLGLGRFEYDPAVLCADAGVEPPIESTEAVELHAWRLSSAVPSSVEWLGPLRYGTAYLERLREADATVLTGANCTGLEISEGRLRAVMATTDQGVTRRLEAQYVVLACGGIENIRQLLLAAEDEPALLRSGRLGLGFADHPHVPVATFLAPAEWLDDPTIRAVPPLFDTDGTAFKLGLKLSEGACRQHRLPNVSFTIETIPDPMWPTGGVDQLDTVTDLWSVVARRPTALFGLYARSEPRAIAASRVALSSGRDDLGVPRAALDWRLDDSDAAAIVSARDVAVAALLSQGAGPAYVESDDRVTAAVTGGAHHLGGAQMHESPELGVVDADLACHAVPNLFVSGSATFPTYCFSNPTLTVVALAIRLADHLAGRP